MTNEVMTGEIQGCISGVAFSMPLFVNVDAFKADPHDGSPLAPARHHRPRSLKTYQSVLSSLVAAHMAAVSKAALELSPFGPHHYQPAELAAAGGVMKKFKELSVAEVQALFKTLHDVHPEFLEAI
jgi:hypothetical protein